MASFLNLSQHVNTRYESPAKVFAKLKSKVQREAKEGICTGRDPLFNVREKHGADFNSPRRRTESTWMPDELKENQRFGSYRNEAEALTLSPITSPQKSIGYSYFKPVVELPPVTDMGHALQSRNQHSPTKRAFLESTDVFHPLVNGFTGTSRTPVKKLPVEKGCGNWMSEEECAPLEKVMSPGKMFSPMRKSLRKRKWGQQEMNKVSSSTKEVCNEVISQRRARKSSTALSEDGTHNNICAEDLGTVRGCSLLAEQSEMNQITHEPTFAQPRSIAQTWCRDALDRIPPMSPAKMFAWMKERENEQEQQEVHKVSSSTRELVDGGHYHQSGDTPLSTADITSETEDAASRGVSESVSPVNRSRLESADSRSETEPSEIPPPAVPSQPVLFEDSLVLNSPRISIPKKNKAMFKHNKWSQQTTFPTESVIHLTKWFLRSNRRGLFVDGLCKESNVPWNSNIIVERVSNTVLKTVSGRVYILVGKMQWVADPEFPKWFLKEFAKGFPPNWKELYEKFQSESRNNSNRETERNREGRSIVAKTTSKSSARNCSVKKHKQKPFKTPDSCPPASSSSSTKVSRSGRVIKPPLEYWKGGRVILDAHMNVTIYEGYDTSICQPEVNTTVCASSQKPARVLCSEGSKQYESTSDSEMPVPLRRVKPPLRKRHRAKVNPEEKPSSAAEPPVETLSHYISSPEEWSGNIRRSSRKKPSTWKSKKETHDTNRPSVRGLRKNPPSESPASHNKVSQRLETSSSNDEFTDKRKKRDKGAQRKRGGKAVNKSQPKRMSLRSQSSEESEKELRKTTRVTKQKQNKTSPPIKPLPKSTQSSKKHKGHKVIPQEQDEDEWTEAELIKLQQAVSCYPKHMAGYWAKVARMVGTRSAEECHNQHTSQGNSQTPAKTAKKTRKENVEAPKKSAPDCPLISAGVGTFKRKQQVRQFLEAMPRDDVEDVFSSAYMQNKRFEIPSMCLSEDHDIALSDLEPVTPMSTRLLEAKTPQCLHITPGMMGSPSRNNGDKYVYQLQKRMKKNQFNVNKQALSSKSFTPTPTMKRKMRRCGNTENDTFVVWEMFPDQEPESGEEEDFYFSDND